ncbi:tetratricopeptide repeat protein [Coraliomargarita sp. W4R53]
MMPTKNLQPLGLLTLGILTILLFSQTISYDFLFWDDHVFLVQNPVVQSGLTDLSHIFSINENVRFMPVVWILCKSIVTLFGISPEAFHAANVLIHGMNAALLAYAVILTFEYMNHTSPTGSKHWGPLTEQLSAFGLAALWAWHPMRVECVSWVTAITYHVCTFFFLLALIAFFKYMRASQSTENRPTQQRRWESLHYLFFALSVFSYPISYTWPIALGFLLPLISPNKKPLQAIRSHIRLPLICAVITAAPLAIMLWARIHTTSTYYTPVNLSVPLTERIHILLQSVGFLAHRSILPVGLTPATWNEAGPYLPASATALGILLTIFLLWTLLYRSTISRQLRWGSLALIAISIPILNPLETTIFLPDRYAHLTQCFLILLIAVFINGIHRVSIQKHHYSNLGILIIATTLAGLSYAQTPKWRDSDTLFEHIEQQPWSKEPHSAYILNRLKSGNYVWNGQYKEAIAAYHELLKQYPNESIFWHQLGLCYFRLEDYSKAEAALSRAITSSPAPAPVSQLLLEHIQRLQHSQIKAK